MNLDRINKVYCIGIGGIGVSALARYFKALGKQVSGYDLTPSPLTQQLMAEGIDIHFTDDPSLIPFSPDEKEHVLVIYTPAVPSNHAELNSLREAGFVIYKRSEVLGLIANKKETIAVAGTHGKTSVSGILSYILSVSELGCSAFLGGISKNFNSNLIVSDSSLMVTEADEFDRSFLQLYPEHAIVTSIDPDHLDIYGNIEAIKDSFSQFVSQIQTGGHLLLKKDLVNIASDQSKLKAYTYSADQKADFYADNIRINTGRYIFDLVCADNQTIKNISLNLPGRINMENAVAAASMAFLLGVNTETIKSGIENFHGMARRFDYQIRSDKVIYIDDYAHHPAELSKTIESLRELYPHKKMTGIFQPHLFTRTRDFAQEFAQSLSELDSVILLEIYPAREKPIEGVSSDIIYNQIKTKDKSLCKKEELLKVISNRKPDFLITFGAGDIDRLVPEIKQILIDS